MADDAAEEQEPKEAEEAEDENIIPSRTKAGIERREREKPELLVAVAEACEFFQMEPSDWQIHRPLRGLGWEAGRHVGTLLKAAALWLPGETGSVGVRCVRLKTNLIGRRGVPLILEGLDPVYATRGPGSATLVELDLAENSLGAPGTRALCEGIVKARYGGLERLDVSGNKCGRDGGKALAELISSPYGVNLNMLLAKDNLMFDDGVGEIGKVSFGALELLDVRNNYFGARGAAALSNGFKENSTLTALNIKENIIALEGLWALGEGLKAKQRSHYRREREKADEYERLPKKERWKMLAARDGWTPDEIATADGLPPAPRNAGESRKDFVKRRLSQINADADAGDPDDPHRGRRKEDVVVTEKYAPKQYDYDVFFFGLDVRPKSLWYKTMGHHIIGAADTVLCSIS